MARFLRFLTINSDSPLRSNRGLMRVNRWLTLCVAAICVALLGVSALLTSCGGDEAASDHGAAPSTAANKPGSDDKSEADKHGGLDLSEDDSLMALLEGEDPSVIEDIIANLEILDYEPTETDMYGESSGAEMVSTEDSVNAAKWINEEEKRLAAKERELNTREKELQTLDKKVSQKLLKLEQAESSRIVQLARLYDGMDARAVAQLAANLDDATVVSILPRMKPKNASLVLQLMPASRAAKLSKQMITIAEN